MEILFHAQESLRAATAKHDDADERLLRMLEGGAHSSEVKMMEEKILDLLRDIEDAQSVVEYYRKKGDSVDGAGVYRLMYHSTRTEHTGDNDKLLSLALQWSHHNKGKDVGGIIIATSNSFFGIVEGSLDAVTSTFTTITRDSRHLNVQKLSGVNSCGRDFALGLKLHCVEEDKLALVLDSVRNDIVVASRYSPRSAIDILSSGGDCQGIVPEASEMPLVAVMMDTICGAVHSAERYNCAAKKLEQLAKKYDGEVLVKFGEYCVLGFVKKGSTFSTNAISAALEFVEDVDASLNTVVGVHVGTVNKYSVPHCICLGSGIRDITRLLEVAESIRRPVIITQSAFDSCSKAHHKLCSYSVDNVPYYVFPKLDAVRLNVPEENFELSHYTGMEPVVHQDSNVVTYRQLSSEEIQRNWASNAVIKGTLSSVVLQTMFREMDPGNVGWIGKPKFRQFLKSGKAFSVFPHDEKKVDGWLIRSNNLGEERISYDEFQMLCLKLQQL